MPPTTSNRVRRGGDVPALAVAWQTRTTAAETANNVDVSIGRMAGSGRKGGAHHGDPPARRRRGGASRSVATGIIETLPTAQQPMSFASDATTDMAGRGRRGGAHHGDLPARRRRGGASLCVATGIVPTAQQARPLASEDTNDTAGSGRGGGDHRGDLSAELRRGGASLSVATDIVQQTRHLAEATKKGYDGSVRSSGNQRVSNNSMQAQHNARSRFVRDVNCTCEACTLRSSGSEIAKWGKSDAKDHLREVLSGDKTHSYWSDPPGQVYDDNKRLFHLYKFSNFSTNLRSLRKGLLSEQEKADFDEIALERESSAFPRGSITSHGNPYYDTSETKKVLVQHAKDGTLEQYKHRPRDLKSSNPIFDEFSDKVFRKHVNREKRRAKEIAGWQWKRNLKGSMKQNAKHEKSISKEEES